MEGAAARYKIERNIPIPPLKYGAGRRPARKQVGQTEALSLLRIGESVLLPGKLSSCCVLSKSLAPKRFTHRTVENGTRVWRIA